MKTVRARSESGFSILEAAVVLAAVSIVAATAGGHIGEFLGTARTIKAKGDVRALATSTIQFLNDVGRVKTTGGGAPPSLLVSDGDIPEIADAAAEPWVQPLDGRLVQDLYAHMVENTAGYPMSVAEGGRWRGPYVEGLGTDPWGSRYSINIGCLSVPGGGAMTLVLSPGPDRVIDTAFRSQTLLNRNTDDVVAILATASEGPVRAADDQTRRSAGAAAPPALTNLCADSRLQQPR